MPKDPEKTIKSLERSTKRQVKLYLRETCQEQLPDWIQELFDAIGTSLAIKVVCNFSTQAVPGTIAKQYRIAERYDNGLPLFHPGDFTSDEFRYYSNDKKVARDYRHKLPSRKEVEAFNEKQLQEVRAKRREKRLRKKREQK